MKVVLNIGSTPSDFDLRFGSSAEIIPQSYQGAASGRTPAGRYSAWQTSQNGHEQSLAKINQY
jgi:hypothetical protein